MAAPKLKLYLLPPTYTEASDDDVRERFNDELLPCVVKQDSLNSVMPMTGVVHDFNVQLIPVDTNSGYLARTLQPAGALHQDVHDDTDWSLILWEVDGVHGPVVVDGNGVQVPASNYKFTNTGVDFTIAPSGTAHLWAFRKGTDSSAPYDTFVLLHDDLYAASSGTNQSCRDITFIADGVNVGNAYAVNAFTNPVTGVRKGCLVTCGGPHTTIVADYWSVRPKSNAFAGAHNNWIAEHMRMWPDIFVGTLDYPGDDGSIDGTPVIQGVVPKFRDIGTYSIDYRDGVVRFPEVIDSAVTPVKANYAYLVGIGNATRTPFYSVDRSMGVWYGSTVRFLFTTGFTSGTMTAMSFYLADITNEGRGVTVNVYDESDTLTGTASYFYASTGVWVNVNLASGYKVVFTNYTGTNVALCGVFYGANSGTDSSIGVPTADVATLGNWQGVYGSAGYTQGGGATSGSVDTTGTSYVIDDGSGNEVSTASVVDHSDDVRVLEGNRSQFKPVLPQVSGKPWVNRNDKWLPRNVYVSGVIAGAPVSVEPYDTLTIKTS